MELTDQKKEIYYFNRLNDKTGKIEQVDMLTGKATPILDTKTQDVCLVDMYTREVSGAICELVRGGKTIAEICRMKGFPLASTVYNWKRLHPGFEEMLEAAFQDRAYHFQDQIIADMEEMDGLTKDDVPAKKLKVDTAFKLMEKANPEKFGSKVQLSGNKDAPLQFIVDTGIRRSGDEGFSNNKFEAIDAEFKKRQSSNDDEIMEVDPENSWEVLPDKVAGGEQPESMDKE